MTGKIFINYRRGDDPGHTGRLFDRLQDAFAPEQLFMDVDSIAPGVDFVRVLEDQVAQCDAMLVVIGPRWLEVMARRLEDPEDFVRFEIEAALKQNKRVIPVLVGEGRMPRLEDLPDVLKPLARRNAVRLTHERFRTDADSLVTALRQTLADGDALRNVQAEERERAAASEREEKQREAEHAARRPQETRAPAAPPTAADPVVAAVHRSPHGGSDAVPPAGAPLNTLSRAAADSGRRIRIAMLACGAAALMVTLAVGYLLPRPDAEPPEAQRRVAEERPPAPREQTAPEQPPPRPIVVEIPDGQVVPPPVMKQPPTAATSNRAQSAPSPLTAQDEQALKPGDAFQECSGCPEMIVVPAGAFVMGAPTDERGRFNWEGPPHPVTIARNFAVGKFEVTFAEWDACLRDGGCIGYSPPDEGWGRDRRPVIRVSWNDAKAYLAWLRRKTGKLYRLLTEAEWEYAARAGSTTIYPFGSDPSLVCKHANGPDASAKKKNRDWEVLPCDDGFPVTSPVGSFSPNALDLYDMIGNVWEWTEDCFNESYVGAPADGSAWLAGNCAVRMVRGGAWHQSVRDLRAARRYYREREGPLSRTPGIGFRIARSLVGN